MFVRYRETKRKLQASLIETRRADGKVQHEHIASLGSIVREPSVHARVEFWARLHGRLARLSNRLSAEERDKVLASIHARVPMPSIDERKAAQLENAKAQV